MLTLKKHFKISKNQNELDFADVDAVGDSKLFINPTLLCFSKNKAICEEGMEKVESFFKTIFNLYASGRREEALQLFTSSGETNANHLGYSKLKSRGNGASKEALAKLFDTILSSGALTSEIMVNPLSLIIFTHNFGEDKMSDLVTSILKKQFVAYTLEIAKKYNIELQPTLMNYGKFWNEKSSSWEQLNDKWIKGADGKHVLFTPKQIVSERYGFSVQDYISKVIFVWRKDYHVSNRTSLTNKRINKYGEVIYDPPTNKILKEKEIDEVYYDKQGKMKAYALDITTENPMFLNQYYNHFSPDGYFLINHILSDEELTNIIRNI